MENGLSEAYERPITYEQIAVNLNVDPSTGAVTGILVLEILVRRTNIFAGKYGPPL